MMTTRHAYVTALFVSSVLTVACSSQHKPGFTADVKPILDKHCAECHMPDGEGAKQSGFQIDSYASIMKGTKFGPVIVPGDDLNKPANAISHRKGAKNAKFFR